MTNQKTQTPIILVADDNRPNQDLLRLWLEAEGYEVISAENGDQAIDFLRSGQIDLALVDVLMPGHSGFAVCRAIKSQPDTRLVPVVLVTGLTNSEDRIQGIESGADDFVSKPVRREELLARVRSLLRLKQFTDELENAETVLYSLALSIEAKDPYTEGHCSRLSKLSVALAEHLNLSREERVALRRAGIVHDIGKIAVPEHILLKPGPLTPEERQIMEQHPVVGERICTPLKSFRNVLPIIRHHHERLDGTGYPDHLKNGQIPLTAQILTTVDVFDSLTTNRPYRQALPLEDAFRVINEEVSRGWWSRELVNSLESLKCCSPSPISSGGLENQSARKIAQRNPAETNRTIMKNRILVVEDNLYNRELLCAWLESEGHAVEAVSTLPESHASLQASPPDLILLDIQLGSQDGLELAAWIRSTPQFQHLPIIAVTAHALVTEQERMMRSGCNACISKPVDFDLLRERMQTWLPRIRPCVPEDSGSAKSSRTSSAERTGGAIP